MSPVLSLLALFGLFAGLVAIGLGFLHYIGYVKPQKGGDKK
jgi:hypothetical protein